MKHRKKAFGVLTGLFILAGLVPQDAKAQGGDSPYIGDIMIVGFNFCPRGWARLDGQLLAISSNDALFSLLGTTFGGDGRTTFALPDLRGRMAVHPNLSVPRPGARGGANTATLTTTNLPEHRHDVRANNQDGDKKGPADKLLAAAPSGGSGGETIYSLAPPNKTMARDIVTSTGQNASFSVEGPKLGLYHCIALVGIYPSRN